jgi:hypothetical protein
MSSASRKLIQASGAVAGAADTGDDDFANVVLLLDGDGTSGDDNNTFTDSSTNAHTITENGSVVQGSFSPYGDNWSNYFDGSGDYLTISQSSSLDLGSGDFTVEAWIYAESATQDSQFRRILATEANGSSAVQLYINASGQVVYTANDDVSRLTGTTNVLNGWHHIAVTRQGSAGGNIKLYVDGSSEGSFTDTASKTSSNFHIGKYPGLSGHFKGYISNIRMVKGTAVYTSSFTPSTSPLTNITNTSLLTCQSNRFADNSSNGFTISVNGDTKVLPFSPFKNDDARDITTDGGSAYIVDGDWLTMPDDSVFVLAGQDFTFECWVYRTDYSTGSGTIYSRWQGSPYAGLRLGVDTTGVAYFYNITTLYGTPTGTVRKNEWTHIAWIYDATGASSGNVTIYVNGEVALSTTAVSGGVSDASTNTDVYVGTLNVYPTQGELHGYLSDFRFVRGTLLYTSAFTPPTAPLTAITNTELLLNFQDAGIYDRTGLNNLDTVGNAQIDTAVKKYGTGSMEFDGTGDHCLLPASEELAMGTGDFTIEMWVNLSAVGSNDGVFVELRSSGATSNGFVFNARRVTSPSAGFKLNFYTDGGSNTASTILAYNTWHHVAVTRSSGTIRMFANGVSDITPFTKNNNFSDTPDVTIGQSLLYSPSNITGYVDDLRITKGIARYTANFTPPEAELPKF